MIDKKTNIATIIANLHITGSGYDLLRYIGLPDMLGKDSDLILYVMGKNLAGKSDWVTIEEVMEFFRHVGWGELQLVKEKRRGNVFQLSGEVIEARIETIENIEFRLEAGFLAYVMEQITSKSCECIAEVKKDFVEFQVMYSD
ncbi:YslB family protein [Gracilibacillus xinjiangensis]|uniref:YslB family protein n=1 Tax=Gracilibacillus xinjiangensis TaxID=1193282 RepID=A0ABV8WWA5_9BACI